MADPNALPPGWEIYEGEAVPVPIVGVPGERPTDEMVARHRLAELEIEEQVADPSAKAILDANRMDQAAREYSMLAEKIRKMRGTYDDLKRMKELEANLRR